MGDTSASAAKSCNTESIWSYRKLAQRCSLLEHTTPPPVDDWTSPLRSSSKTNLFPRTEEPFTPMTLRGQDLLHIFSRGLFCEQAWSRYYPMHAMVKRLSKAMLLHSLGFYRLLIRLQALSLKTKGKRLLTCSLQRKASNFGRRDAPVRLGTLEKWDAGGCFLLFRV